MKIIKRLLGLFIFIFFLPSFLDAQSGEVLTITADDFKDNKFVQLGSRQWKYRAGDDANWAARDFDDAAWEIVEGTSTIKPEFLTRPEWNGRAWFRLRVQVDESLADKSVALITVQRGASEVYLDGQLLAKFGEITDKNVTDYNPNRLPIPFRFGAAGEHLVAVRFASEPFADMTDLKARWLSSGGIYPGLSIAFREANDLNGVIGQYAETTSMRAGFLFVGFLLALALLHFLLYLFYRVERANLFYSVYAGSLGIFIFFNNLIYYGHQPIGTGIYFTIIATMMLGGTFIGLLAFIRIAFGRPLGKIFWALTAIWIVSVAVRIIFLNNSGIFITTLGYILIGLSFMFSIFLLVQALREKRSGAWILMGGVQIFAFAMMANLVRQFNLFVIPDLLYQLAEISVVLAVPTSVSVYLARNFARTNRDLSAQLVQVERLSQEKIEQQRHAAELRAENERRVKELEEARQLQFSMLPKKLPNVPNLEIAVYMKPATEVGGDYYDFHVSSDGTLTVAVGDATGHGLKAGTVVAATKSLFRAFANEKDITNIFRQSSQALKEMNLRGLFMAMTILKIKDNTMRISSAGMPSTLVYRAESKLVEELSIRAMPLGSVAKFPYQQQEISLSSGDTIVILSDGFPEMFNTENEMLGFAEAADVLPDIAGNSSQEIINRFVEVGEKWAGNRPPDDDVTFVVMKVK